MRHRKAGRKLGRSGGHRRALYRNLITELFRHERIKTTEAKAKAIQSKAEKLITLGKRGTLHSRRLAAGRLNDKEIVKKMHLLGLKVSVEVVNDKSLAEKLIKYDVDYIFTDILE